MISMATAHAALGALPQSLMFYGFLGTVVFIDTCLFVVYVLLAVYRSLVACGDAPYFASALLTVLVDTGFTVFCFFTFLIAIPVTGTFVIHKLRDMCAFNMQQGYERDALRMMRRLHQVKIARNLMFLCGLVVSIGQGYMCVQHAARLDRSAPRPSFLLAHSIKSANDWLVAADRQFESPDMVDGTPVFLFLFTPFMYMIYTIALLVHLWRGGLSSFSAHGKSSETSMRSPTSPTSPKLAPCIKSSHVNPYLVAGADNQAPNSPTTRQSRGSSAAREAWRGVEAEAERGSHAFISPHIDSGSVHSPSQHGP